MVTSSWGLLFDLSLNWITYPGTNGQKIDQAVMILILLKRIRNFELEPFTILHCSTNSGVHHQLFPTYSLSQLTLRSGDCKSTKLTLFLFILKRKHFNFVTAWMSYLSDVSVPTHSPYSSPPIKKNVEPFPSLFIIFFWQVAGQYLNIILGKLFPSCLWKSTGHNSSPCRKNMN